MPVTRSSINKNLPIPSKNNGSKESAAATRVTRSGRSGRNSSNNNEPAPSSSSTTTTQQQQHHHDGVQGNAENDKKIRRVRKEVEAPEKITASKQNVERKKKNPVRLPPAAAAASQQKRVGKRRQEEEEEQSDDDDDTTTTTAAVSKSASDQKQGPSRKVQQRLPSPSSQQKNVGRTDGEEEQSDDEDDTTTTTTTTTATRPTGSSDQQPPNQRVNNQNQGQSKKDHQQQQQGPSSVAKITNTNQYLPPRSLFPLNTATHTQQASMFENLQSNVLTIVSRLMNQVQLDDSSTTSISKNYERIEKLYEYADGIMEDSRFLKNYRLMVVKVLWQFGPVVWKETSNNNNNNNPYAQRVAGFLEYCFMRLGWKQDNNNIDNNKKKGKRSKSKNWKMTEFKVQGKYPACYFVVKLFAKDHNAQNKQVRQNQLELLLTLSRSSRSQTYPCPNHFLTHVYSTAYNSIQIRLKDKSSSCRSLALQLMTSLIKVEGAAEQVLKQLKYYTRYDPCVEIRRLGTIAIGRDGRTRLRFFYDQAFDRNASVRAEAFRVMGLVTEVESEEEEEEEVRPGSTVANAEDGMEEQHDDEERGGGGITEQQQQQPRFKMIRDMGQLTAEKLCKVILWGLVFSDAKCSTILKQEVLPNWLKYSCENNLIKFLSNLDAYENMRSVIKIMDILLTTEEQLRFVEQQDTRFIQQIKEMVFSKQYHKVTIESMVAWLSLCKASDKVECLKEKVIPSCNDMLLLIQCLHECAFLEHDKSQRDGGNEDVSPIICAVVALEITKFIVWEEAGRRSLQKILRELLLDPIMDERVLILQAMSKLYSFVSKEDFEDIMMSVFQDVFDANNEFNRKSNNLEIRRASSSIDRRNSTVNSNVSVLCGDPEIEVNRGGEEEENQALQQQQQPVVTKMTMYELTKLREKVCNLGLHRYKLMKERDQLIQEKKFMDAVPLNNEILKIQAEESDLKAELEFQEELARRPPPPPAAVPTPPPPAIRLQANSSSLTPTAAAPPPPRQGPYEEDNMDVDNDNASQAEQQQPSSQQQQQQECGVITSIEDGLAKGIFMINTYLDLVPGMNAFVRNFYENYAPQFLTDQDVVVRLSIVQFCTRVAMNDKRELKKITNMLMLMLLGDCEVAVRNVAYQGLVDLIIIYEYEDFLLTEEEKRSLQDNNNNNHQIKMLVKDYTDHLTLLVHNQLKYEEATPSQISAMFIELLTKKFPSPQHHSSLTTHELSLLFTTKNQGLLKLLIRGKLREPSLVANVIGLWVNQDYAGTPVLRDLEHVLTLYNTFEWWGSGYGDNFQLDISGASSSSSREGQQQQHGDDNNDDDNNNNRGYVNERLRLLGLALGEAVVNLCQNGGGSSSSSSSGGVEPEDVIKFVGYICGFLDNRDQTLMLAISKTILTPVSTNPTRSYNTTLVKAASRIPLTTPTSARAVVLQIDNILKAMVEHPMTVSLVSLKKELQLLLNKLKKVHGDEILKMRDARGRVRVIGRDLDWGDQSLDEHNGGMLMQEQRHSGDDDEEEEEENRVVVDGAFSDSD